MEEDEEFDPIKYESYARLPDVAVFGLTSPSRTSADRTQVDELGRGERFKCDGPEKLPNVDDVWRKKTPELYIDCPPRVDRKEAEEKEAKKYAMRREAERVDALFRSLAANTVTWPASAALPALLPALAPDPAVMLAPPTSMAFVDSFAIPEEYWDGENEDEDENKDEDNDADGQEEEDHDWSHLSSGLPPVLAQAPTPTDAAPGAGMSVNLMSPAPVPSSPFVAYGGQYQDVDEDKNDAEGYYEDDTHTQISATVMWDRHPVNSFVSPAPVFAPAPTPASSVIAYGDKYQDVDEDDRDDTGPLAFPAALPAPAPTASVPAPTPPAPAPNVGVPVANPAAVPAPVPPTHPPAILMPSSSLPAGFRMYRMPNRTVASGRFLVGPGYGGRDVRPPPLNLESLHEIEDRPKRQGSCAWCPCSKWLWDPYFFMRPDNPTGARRLCNRCACRLDLDGNFPAGMNDWLEQNQPVMFQLVRGDRVR